MIPTNTQISVELQTRFPSNPDALIVFLSEKGEIGRDVRELLGDGQVRSIQRLIDAKVVSGKAREVGFDLVECGRDTYRRVYVVGLGPQKQISPESVRQAAGAAARAVRKHRLGKIAMIPPELKPGGDSGAEAAVTGFLLASFDYSEYRGAAQAASDEQKSPRRVQLTLLSKGADARKLKAQVERARIIAESQNFARTIATRPGNDINPPRLAEVTRQMCRELGLACRVLDEKELKRLGMGGILAVGGGSNATPPRLIVMEYKPRGARKSDSPLLVVGKAITFDSGGISIKPAEKMHKMVFDKCGAMAVLGLMAAVARLKPDVRVVGILSSAENLLSETSYRPGDILRMYNGVTVEVTNTDAEGRLVLGDALAWGIETYRPKAVVNLATLTGGCVIALGPWHAGMMSNNDGLSDEIRRCAERAGERVWRLPLGEPERDAIKSDVADIVNSAGRYGSPITAGAFLSYFVPRDNSVPWVHLDIAGVADTEKELPYIGKGATGWGVRTLVEWICPASS